jgi:hypothetical protein
MYYIPNILYHIHPIYSLSYLNNWTRYVRVEKIGRLRAPGGRSARPGGLSARKLRAQPAGLPDFLISNVSFCGPIVLCPWGIAQGVIYFVCGCSFSPLPHSYNTTPSSPSHSLSPPSHEHHLHCPWNQSFHSSTAREASLRATRTFLLWVFIHWNLSHVQPRARTRYLQSSIDLSTRCIS